jgi:hypothetical protein
MMPIPGEPRILHEVEGLVVHSIAWAPDGHIVFAVRGQESIDLMRIHPEGGEARTLLSMGSDEVFRGITSIRTGGAWPSSPARSPSRSGSWRTRSDMARYYRLWMTRPPKPHIGEFLAVSPVPVPVRGDRRFAALAAGGGPVPSGGGGRNPRAIRAGWICRRRTGISVQPAKLQRPGYPVLRHLQGINEWVQDAVNEASTCTRSAISPVQILCATAGPEIVPEMDWGDECEIVRVAP